MKCKRVAFGAGHAYTLSDPADEKRVHSIIPDVVMQRQPVCLSSTVAAALAANTYSILEAPPGQRVLLVLTILHGKRMCFIVSESTTYLISLHVQDKQMFANGSVLEGFIHDNPSTNARTLCLTDTLFWSGTIVDGIPYSLRYAMLIIFTTTHLIRREKDSVAMTVAHLHDSTQCNISVMHERMLPMLLIPHDEPFQTQVDNKTYYRHAPNLMSTKCC